jgi:NADPH:quinone reductase
MVKAIQVQEYGGPEVLSYTDVEVAPPGAGEVRVRHNAIGVNFIDTYFRTGQYQAPALPFTPGSEGAGIVVAAGEGVTDFQPGERVAYAGSLGSYAEERNIPAQFLVKIPEGVSDETAAAMMLKGLTAQYLLRRTYRVEPGFTILFHAAAGGVGLIACQWAKALGLKLIGTAGSEEKCALARDNGAAFTINYRSEDFAARVKEITGGRGVKVVYDSIGKDTWDKSLDCLRPFGLMASFGNASGVVPPFAPVSLGPKGSLYVTRQTLATHIATREAMQAMADDLFAVVASGEVKIHIAQRYPLAEAAQAHRDLEARKTTGSTILTI